MLKVNKEISDLFLEKIRKLLGEGKTRSVRKKKKTIKNVFGVNDEKDFVLIAREITRTEEDTEYLDGVPEKILDLVYQSLSVENSIKHLQSLGYVVIDPSLPIEKDDNQGLTESTVNLIKSKILGIG